MTSGSFDTSYSMIGLQSAIICSVEVDTKGTTLARGNALAPSLSRVLFAPLLCSVCMMKRSLQRFISMSLTDRAETLTANSKSCPSRTLLKFEWYWSRSSASLFEHVVSESSPSFFALSSVRAQPFPLIRNSVVELMHARVLSTSPKDIIRLRSTESSALAADSVEMEQMSLRVFFMKRSMTFSNSFSSKVLTSLYWSSEFGGA
mmetsp:Transcript_3233/g.8990  ORF Transcript_3233/g.8990 Transcript_3233/m.8990 type:complete len:204 (+) Transcript_3233:940-1551(+)